MMRAWRSCRRDQGRWRPCGALQEADDGSRRQRPGCRSCVGHTLGPHPVHVSAGVGVRGRRQVDGHDLECLQAARGLREVGRAGSARPPACQARGATASMYSPVASRNEISARSHCRCVGRSARSSGPGGRGRAVDEVGEQPFEGRGVLAGCARAEGESALVGALAGERGRLAGRLEGRRRHADHPALRFGDVEVGEDVEVVEVLDAFGADLGPDLCRRTGRWPRRARP